MKVFPIPRIYCNQKVLGVKLPTYILAIVLGPDLWLAMLPHRLAGVDLILLGIDAE